MPSQVPSPVLLFTAGDLTNALGRDISEGKAALAERIVWGWLKGPAGLTDRPTEISDELFAAAVELGGIYVENPSGMSEKQLGTSQQAFSSERRAAILLEVGGESTTSSHRPRGSFPAAPCYPDPAFGGYSGGRGW